MSKWAIICVEVEQDCSVDLTTKAERIQKKTIRFFGLTIYTYKAVFVKREWKD